MNELSPKVGAALLRSAFKNKGAVVSHTEALDLLAKLKGYEAWSHMQQAAKSSKPQKEKAKKTRKLVKLQDILIEYYGLKNEWPLYPRAEQDVMGDAVYWEDALAFAEHAGILEEDEVFHIDQSIPVTLPNGAASTWNIEQNLTDRWGEFNHHDIQNKAGLRILELDTALFYKLLEMMPGEYEMSFAARKDQKLGVLFEAEFCSKESEAHYGEDENLIAHETVVASLLGGLVKLQKVFPSVEFCIPDKEQIVNDRPAVWAFVKPDTLTKAECSDLASALYDL